MKIRVAKIFQSLTEFLNQLDVMKIERIIHIGKIVKLRCVISLWRYLKIYNVMKFISGFVPQCSCQQKYT